MVNQLVLLMAKELKKASKKNEAVFGVELGILTKLFSVLLFLSYLIFSFQRRLGTTIERFSALDLLMVMFVVLVVVVVVVLAFVVLPVFLFD